MSTTVRVRRHIDSLNLPELAEFLGKEVKIVVIEVPKPTAQGDDEFPLRGTILWFEDPDGPAVPEEDWEAASERYPLAAPSSGTTIRSGQPCRQTIGKPIENRPAGALAVTWRALGCAAP
jgi:hypothetical protein